MLKIQNKKAFTIIELVVAVIILGVILAFALPNITSTLERNNKDKLIVDAKDMVEKTKNYMLKNNEYPKDDADPSTNDCNIYYLKDGIDPREEIKDSPYGALYDRDNSGVKVCLEEGSYTYYVQLIDDNNGIKNFVDYMKLNTEEKYTLVETN